MRAESVLIAQVLKRARPDVKGGTIGERRVWSEITRELANLLGAQDPAFDRAAFWAEADYNGEGL